MLYQKYLSKLKFRKILGARRGGKNWYGGGRSSSSDCWKHDKFEELQDDTNDQNQDQDQN